MEDHGAQVAAPEWPERRERRDARENRRQLLAVAKNLFATQGVEATSMKEIARAAGVGQGTLYRHFEHKGALCQALIHDDLAEFEERVGALVAAGEAAVPPLTRLRRLISERIGMTETHLPLFAAMDAASGPRRGPGPRGPFDCWTHERIVALLHEALARGEAVELDPDLIADALLAAMGPPLYRYQRHECGHSPERIIATLHRLFITGLRRGLPA